ncbi:MAG: flagellar biosynthetic protein FliR [Phycisphaerae bacterium]
MEALGRMVVPLVLVLARVSGFLVSLPIFGWRMAPARVKVGMALVLTLVFAMVVPVDASLVETGWPAVAFLVVREVLTGIGLGVAVAIVFASVRQAGMIIKRQMGLAVAREVNPMTGEQSQPVGMLMEMCFAVFFLAAGGHRLMLRLIVRSWEVFPVGQWPEVGHAAEAVLDAGLAMLLFALRLAAPMLAAFLVLAVALGILARILPEMNILIASLPMRIGLGLFMAAAILPTLQQFTSELGDWINRLLVT